MNPSPSSSSSSATAPALHSYEHNGVYVSDLPDSQKPQPYLDETHKANDHRTGAEALAPMVSTSSAGHASKGPHDGNASGTAAAAVPPPHGANKGGPPSGPGGPGGGGRPQLDKFAYGFWDPQMAFFRKIVFKILGGGAMITIIIMWLALPAYWGSLWLSNVYTNNLTVRIVDYDGGAIGSAVVQGLMARTAQLGYFTSSASEWPSAQGLIDSVLEENEWAAITINSGATNNLRIARQNGLASYNGTSAVSVYYSQARNELAMNSYLVPYVQAALGQITGQLSAQTAASYLQANVANATAIGLLAQAPGTISNSISYTLNNLRPYNQPVANAITLVGLIYMLIFSFVITMMNNGAREIISPYLTTKSYIMYRLITPLLMYMPISFFFSMVSLPFDIHFDAHFSYAGGFFLWAFTTYLGMAALGLATEFAITIIGAKFIAFFLVSWIIVNVCTVALPHELQAWIFRYGPAMPFYNINRTVRTIIFNTKNDIAQNLGILLAWIALSLITVSLATWLGRRKAVNQHRAAKEEVTQKGEKGIIQ